MVTENRGTFFFFVLVRWYRGATARGTMTLLNPPTCLKVSYLFTYFDEKIEVDFFCSIPC